MHHLIQIDLYFASFHYQHILNIIQITQGLLG